MCETKIKETTSAQAFGLGFFVCCSVLLPQKSRPSKGKSSPEPLATTLLHLLLISILDNVTSFLFSVQPNSQSLHTGHGRCANVHAKCSDSNENISGVGEEHRHKHGCFESALARAGSGDPGLDSTELGWPQTPDKQRKLMLPEQQPHTPTAIHISDWGSFGTLLPCKALQMFPQSILTLHLRAVLHRLG